MSQLELPLFEEIRSTADDPVPEQERTHPAQMVIQHCGKTRQHVSHTRQEVGGWVGCPGTPDLRDSVSVAAGEHVREQIRQMETLTYDCGGGRGFHAPHPIAGMTQACPGLVTLRCSAHQRHDRHRWWSIPDAFYWCDGLAGVTYGPLPRPLFGRRVEDVELP